ncbi:MAG: hypothetical protein Kow0047_03110 [Anaerolineae bacterium]
MDPLSATVLDKLVDTVTGRVFDALADTATARARAWLGREPARLAFKTALLRSINRFAEAHPDWAAALLDETFFTGEAVTRELARLLTGRDAPDVEALAAAWAAQLPQVGERYRDEAARALADFLCFFKEELGNQEALRSLFDSRALERIAENTEALLEALREQHAAALRAADRSVRIAGDVHNALIVTGAHNTVQVFLGAAPVDHRPRVQRFLEEYLGTSSRPVPFGGRVADLQRLSAWLEGETRPYFFLHAPAGRGKSALLARWATAVAREEA